MKVGVADAAIRLGEVLPVQLVLAEGSIGDYTRAAYRAGHSNGGNV
jgi:hypothetical protein